MVTVISANNIQMNYGQHQVFKKLQLTVKPGEIIGLVGENGAGKTTLLNILLGLLKPQQGSIEVLGTTADSKVNKQHIGAMLQDNSGMSRIRVGEMIQLTRSYYQQPYPYKKVLELANLTAQEKQMTDKLSGGQKRRLSFALALAGNPQLLFLDEPTVGMDVQSRQSFWQNIEILRQEKRTIIVTSHYLEELETLASRLLILQNGNFVFDGTLPQLRKQFDRATIEFDSTLPLSTLKSFITEPIQQQGHHFQIKTAHHNQLIQALTPKLNAITNLYVYPNSLNDVFVHLTAQEAQHA